MGFVAPAATTACGLGGIGVVRVSGLGEGIKIIGLVVGPCVIMESSPEGEEMGDMIAFGTGVEIVWVMGGACVVATDL